MVGLSLFMKRILITLLGAGAFLCASAQELYPFTEPGFQYAHPLPEREAHGHVYALSAR
jgi:hypothetical protein